MKRTLSRSAAAASTGAAVLARVFYGLTIEAPDPMGGAWASALLGLMLSLPALWLLMRCKRHSAWLAPVFSALLLLDAASAMECAGFSASYLAFSHAPVAVLMLPLALAAWRCSALGGDALGASARVWMWALSGLMLVVMLFQWPYYHPAWALPLFSGTQGLLKASLRVAGWITTLAGAAILLCDEVPRTRWVLGTVASAMGVALALVLLRRMMTPPGAYLAISRSVRVDSLLTNGRAPLALQLPMIVIWFMAMLHLLSYETFACGALIKLHIPWISIVLAALLLAATRAFQSFPLTFISDYRFPALLALACAGREAQPCAK